MDIKGGIPRGADFERVLTDKLAGCEVLLVLVGPKWLTCTRSDGTRRLDVPDDWVRKEIASALQRNIPVVPVLLGGAGIPEKSQLPDALRSLPIHEAAAIRERSFDYDFAELVKDMKRQTSLRDVGELHHPEASTIRLRELIYQMPAAADQMSRSAHAAEVARERVKELELYKTVHDLLHHIEFDIQRIIQATGRNVRLRDFRNKFNDVRREILTATEGHELPCTRAALVEALQSTTDAFKDAGDAPSQDAYDILLSELNGLLYFANFLDGAISIIKDQLDLDEIAVSIGKVQDLMPVDYSVDDPDLENAIRSFSRSVQVLRDMQRELDWRVREHKQFQVLDSQLRMICKGNSAQPSKHWKKVKQLRSLLTQPLPDAWQDKDLETTESKIDAAILECDEPKVGEMINQYFSDVSSVFYYVDKDLKKFVGRLNQINPELDALLGASRNGGRT
jgi:hypothetical protein